MVITFKDVLQYGSGLISGFFNLTSQSDCANSPIPTKDYYCQARNSGQQLSLLIQQTKPAVRSQEPIELIALTEDYCRSHRVECVEAVDSYSDADPDKLTVYRWAGVHGLGRLVMTSADADCIVHPCW